MAGDLFNSTSIPILQQVMAFSEARHTVLAGNIANVDTPGYRVRDLSVETFQDRLREAIDARDNQAVTAARGNWADPDEAMKQVGDASQMIVFHDESDGQLEEQVASMTENKLLHDLALTIMDNQFRQLEAAISERL